MKLKVFTLRLDPTTGIFDESELSEFQSGKDVIEVSEHFLVHEETPALLLVVRYPRGRLECRRGAYKRQVT
jgi:hypothetical protein